jgi:hypothetical protein
MPALEFPVPTRSGMARVGAAIDFARGASGNDRPGKPYAPRETARSAAPPIPFALHGAGRRTAVSDLSNRLSSLRASAPGTHVCQESAPFPSAHRQRMIAQNTP